MIVIDSSVAFKWIVAEDRSDEAAALLLEDLVAPDLILAECANALWKKVRRDEQNVADAVEGLSLVERSVSLEPLLPLTEGAFAIACELMHPAYDCYYLALAAKLEIQLASADKRLIARCAGTRFEGLFHDW